MKTIVQNILKALGYYSIKSQWRWHQYITRLQKEDAARKAEALVWLETIDHRLLPDVKKTDNVTVSLTSHGKRVADFAPFAIYSLFHQTMLPNRIMLNINREIWTEDSLPDLIKKLQIAGLEVNFCEDVGPHTKLLPALEKYPDDVIITVDDDIYYDKELIEELTGARKVSEEKNIVVCRTALEITQESGKIRPYSQWRQAKPMSKEHLSPFGWSGVLYSPHIFTDEVFNKDVYRNLCPHADDIWFTVMEMTMNIPSVMVKDTHWTGKGEIDHKNEYEAQNSDALHFNNVTGGGNDKQLAALVEYYNLNELMSERIRE
jgi:hypothetical protein